MIEGTIPVERNLWQRDIWEYLVGFYDSHEIETIKMRGMSRWYD